MATNENAAAALTTLFESYGLGSLAPKILELIQQYGPDNTDQVLLALRDTTEYKERFKANEARKKAGMTTLSPAEYIAQEEGYREALRLAGLPAGFYDSQDDFVKFLERDVSPNELAQRAAAATERALSVDQVQRQVLSQFGIDAGALAAYFLDPDRALPDMLQRYQTAALAAESQRAFGTYNEAMAESLAQAGVSVEQARQGYGEIGQELDTLEKLGGISGEEFDLEAAERATFFNDAGAQNRERRLRSQERARFSGSGATTRTSLTRDDRFSS